MGGNNKVDYKQSVSGFSLKAEPTEFVNGVNVRNKKEKIKINSQDLGLSYRENYDAIYQDGGHWVEGIFRRGRNQELVLDILDLRYLRGAQCRPLKI